MRKRNIKTPLQAMEEERDLWKGRYEQLIALVTQACKEKDINVEYDDHGDPATVEVLVEVVDGTV